MRKKIAFCFVGFACASFLWLSSAEAGTSLKKVRLAYAGWEVGTAISYIGIDAGIFRKYDLDVEEVFIRDALTGGIQSLIGVDLVVGFGNPIHIVQPIVGGADVVFLGAHVSMEQYRMAVSSDIATIRDLKGKKVGVSILGGKSDLIARAMLRRVGLDPLQDVQIVAAGLAPSRVVALSQNLIQGAPVPFKMASETKKLGFKILQVEDVPLITALLMTTRSFIKKDEEAVRRFTKGYLDAIHHYLTRREQSIAIIKKYFTGTNPNAIEAMYDSYAAQLKPLPTPNREAVQALIDAASVIDAKSREIKPSDLFEPRFMDELKANGFVDDLYAEKIDL
jgi:ABC-type nitrate/sulfonate/bicarbonate transport system substrate-binding protein